jgi:hypothetical protein
MNFMNKFLLVITIAGMFLVGMSSCEKSELRATEYDLPKSQAFVRFVFVSPGLPAVMIKMDNKKINGNTTSGTAGLFPLNSGIAEYAAVAPNGALRLSLANTGTSNDSVVLFTGNLTIDADKFYTTILADSGSTRTLFSVPDDFGNLPDSGFTRLRFINATGKSPGLSLVRIDSTSATVVSRDTLFRNVEFSKASNFATFKNQQNLFLRYRLIQTSNGAILGTTYTPTFSPTLSNLNRRAITIVSGGIWQTTFTPGISLQIVNQ